MNDLWKRLWGHQTQGIRADNLKMLLLAVLNHNYPWMKVDYVRPHAEWRRIVSEKLSACETIDSSWSSQRLEKVLTARKNPVVVQDHVATWWQKMRMCFLDTGEFLFQNDEQIKTIAHQFTIFRTNWNDFLEVMRWNRDRIAKEKFAPNISKWSRKLSKQRKTKIQT